MPGRRFLALFRTRYALPLWSGIGLGLSFPPYPLPFLGWLALVPLLLFWERAPRASDCFKAAYPAFLLTFGVAFFWPLLHVMQTFAGRERGS